MDRRIAGAFDHLRYGANYEMSQRREVVGRGSKEYLWLSDELGVSNQPF